MRPPSNLVRGFTRRLLGAASLAAVVAAAGDPAPLLELQRAQARPGDSRTRRRHRRRVRGDHTQRTSREL
jgi:hypothetical protein